MSQSLITGGADRSARAFANAPAVAHKGRSRANLGGAVAVQIGATSSLARAEAESARAQVVAAGERRLADRQAYVGRRLPPLPRELRFSMLSLFAARHGRVKTDHGQDRSLRAARDIVRKPRLAGRMGEELEAEDDTVRLLRLLELSDLIRDGQAGDDRGGEALEAIEEAIDELMAKSGDRILADINTFDATASLPAEQAAPFRQAYVDLVQGAESLSAMLDCVLSAMKEQPQKAFTEVLAKFREALGLDAAAVRPSTDPVRLKALMSDLWHLTMIETLLEQADELGAALQKQHGCAPLEAKAFVSDLVGLSAQRHADGSSVARLASRHGVVEPPAAKVAFLAGVAGIVAGLPTQIAVSKDARDALIAASREALDGAIRDEEDAAWMAQGQGG